MKKAAFCLLLFLGIVFFVSGQTPEPIDLILVLDTSVGMSGSYQEVIDYISGPFLREFLRIGDTFHLISFSGSPRSEISRRIEGVGDVETVIGRLFLMVPLEPYTDIAGALDYTARYAARIPASRSRKVVFVTGGEQNPEPGTSAMALDSGALETRINETAARLRGNGTDFYLVRFPLTGNGPSSGRRSGTVQAAPPAIQRPAAAQQPPVTAQQPPVTAQQPPVAAPQPPITVQQSPVTAPASPVTVPELPVTASELPATAQESPVTASEPPAAGSQPPVTVPELPVTAPQPPITVQQPPVTAPASPVTVPELPVTASEIPVTAPQPPLTVQQPPVITPEPPAVQPDGRVSASQGFNYVPLLAGLGGAVVLILGLIIFFTARKLRASPNRAMAYAADQRKAETGPVVPVGRSEKDTGKTPPTGSLLLSLVVDDQNANIGRRNIHSIKAGDIYTIGGSQLDDYFIFLVPLPAHIGEVHFNGKECTFVPKKTQYFPETGSRPVSDCIGKSIRVVSDKRYELTFHLERYEDPLDSLNRLLNSVVLPPKPPEKGEKS